jgi:hypothetical protein
MKLAAALLTATLCLGIAAIAFADVDPPSDVLLLDNVYFPYQPRVCVELRNGLDQLTADAKKAHYPVKVALVSSATDLGGIPQEFGRPQEYAEFLHSEIGRQTKSVTLAAMPGGFGFAPPDNPEKAVLDKIKISDKADSNELARAALDAVPKLAAAAGHPVKKPNVGSKCSKKGGSSSALIFIVPVALLLIAGGAITLGRRSPDEN